MKHYYFSSCYEELTHPRFARVFRVHVRALLVLLEAQSLHILIISEDPKLLYLNAVSKIGYWNFVCVQNPSAKIQNRLTPYHPNPHHHLSVWLSVCG